MPLDNSDANNLQTTTRRKAEETNLELLGLFFVYQEMKKTRDRWRRDIISNGGLRRQLNDNSLGRPR